MDDRDFKDKHETEPMSYDEKAFRMEAVNIAVSIHKYKNALGWTGKDHGWETIFNTADVILSYVNKTRQ